MKKILFAFFLVLLASGAFLAYHFVLVLDSKDFQAKSYEDIKAEAEKGLEKMPLEDLYILANTEDREDYYKALYNAYKQEDPDLGLQYLYNEFVLKNNQKVYPLLKEEAKSDVRFNAEETGYLGALKNYNKYPEEESFKDDPYNFEHLFVPKFYDSKSTDEFVYDLRAKNYDLVGNLTPAGDWPYLIGRYIDKSGSYELNLNASSGFQDGEDKLYFKNFDGKTVLAFSLTDYAYSGPFEDTYPAICQFYIYKDYVLEICLASESDDPAQYRNWGIGTINLDQNQGYITYYKGLKEISKEEFENNVVPVDRLVNLSKKESKSWTKISTNPYLEYDWSNERITALNKLRYNIFNNLLLYTYNISLSQDVNIPYLRPYLKHLYTLAHCPNLNKVEDDPSKEAFTAYICDLDGDGYPEIIMNYMLNIMHDENRQHHVKVISYDPEKKSTYSLADFIYANGDGGLEEFQAGGIYRKDGKNYLVILRSDGHNQGFDYCIGLYEKEGRQLNYVDSSYKVVEYDPDYIKATESYPNKASDYQPSLYRYGKDPENNLFLNIPLAAENSKEKYDNLYNQVFTDQAKEDLEYNGEFPKALYKSYEGLHATALHDPEEIKDILLANKLLQVPIPKRLVIGNQYYPISAILKAEGKEYIDVRALKTLDHMNLGQYKTFEKNKQKYISLDDLKQANLVQEEYSDYLILKK